jgi:hypothetical protein
MPRYDPAIIGTQELEEDMHKFNVEIMILNEEINYDMNAWGDMIRSDLPQEDLDKQENLVRSKSRKRKMLMNKRLKAQVELNARDTREFLYLRRNVAY